MKRVWAVLLALTVLCSASLASAETYTASAQGFGGEVSVEFVIEGADITACMIKGDSETPGVGSMAVEQMPERFVEADSCDVDGVTLRTRQRQAHTCLVRQLFL